MLPPVFDVTPFYGTGNLYPVPFSCRQHIRGWHQVPYRATLSSSNGTRTLCPSVKAEWYTGSDKPWNGIDLAPHFVKSICSTALNAALFNARKSGMLFLRASCQSALINTSGGYPQIQELFDRVPVPYRYVVYQSVDDFVYTALTQVYFYKCLKVHFKAVFRICDVLIRIWIRGSVPLDYGCGSVSGSCSFLQWISRGTGTSKKKEVFSHKFICSSLTKGTFTWLQRNRNKL